MMKELAKSFPVIGLVLIALLVGAGCPKPGPTPPDYLPYFVASPTSLDFGTDKVTMKLYISKNYTAQPLPTFSVASAGAAWLSVSPSTGNSTGPSAPAAFTVTVDRSMLGAGANTSSVVATAPGVEPLSVPVTATARISADFVGTPVVVQLGEAVDFTDQSGVAPGEAPITSWTWDFGDGTSSPIQNPQHVYAAQGQYTVTLTVSNGTLTDTEQKVGYISVEGPLPPTANFMAATTTPVVGSPVQFTDLSSPGSATQIDTWAWNFGDGNMSALQNPSHTYNTIANFTVSLTVTTTIGNDTLTRTSYIMVQPMPPTAQFMADDTTPGVGQTVNFTDMSTPGSAASINSWLWNFGDGGASALQNPTHIYTAIANYTVSLTVTATSGQDTEIKPSYINVHAKKFLERQASGQ